jgi:hypothetical protein
MLLDHNLLLFSAFYFMGLHSEICLLSIFFVTWQSLSQLLLIIQFVIQLLNFITGSKHPV